MEKKKQGTVMAELVLDDGRGEVTFDCAPWLAKASTEDIVALAGCGFGGDYPADKVAEESTDDPVVAEFFKAHEGLNGMGVETGFECRVDEEAALAFLAANRPETMDGIRSA